MQGMRSAFRCGRKVATPLMRLVNDRPKIPGYRETVAALDAAPKRS